MSQQKYVQYIDQESGVVKRPEGEGWSDPFGDGVWRSSWFYASLLVIQNKDGATYDRLKAEHGVDISFSAKFLRFFRDNCISDTGWRLPKHSDQQFTRDQLVPLLYFLMAVQAYAPDYANIAKDILMSLGRLEEAGRGVSDTSNGRIGRNIGYMIDVLARKYGFVYRTSDMDYWRASAIWNENAAKANRRAAYKKMFTLALEAHELGGWIEKGGLEASDSYSVFNALGAVSLQAIAWGKEDQDVRDWRSNFRVHAEDGWGPAFEIVAGQTVVDDIIDEYYTAHVTNHQDNDIIMAQRPRKIRDGILHPRQKGEEGQWLVLDYVVLKALKLLWS
jgi:hypothetical protein